MLVLQYMHDNLLKRHIFSWALHAKWYPSVLIDIENRSETRTWERVIWRSMSKQNRRCISTSCWHCHACMIICWKGTSIYHICKYYGPNPPLWKIPKINAVMRNGLQQKIAWPSLSSRHNHHWNGLKFVLKYDYMYMYCKIWFNEGKYSK